MSMNSVVLFMKQESKN